MKKYDVYLFDFDGTLVDSAFSLIQVFKKSYQKVGIEIKEEDIDRLMKVPLIVGYKEHNGPIDKFNDYLQSIGDYLHDESCTSLTKIYPETAEVINKLNEQNKIVGIVTSNSSQHVADVLKFLKIDVNLFQVIVGHGESPECKPSPAPILKALEMLNYQGDKKSVVYVGDSENDYKAGVAAEVDSYLIDRNKQYDESYSKISNLKEML